MRFPQVTFIELSRQWLVDFLAYLGTWGAEVDSNLQILREHVDSVGSKVQILTGAEAAAMVEKRQDVLYACSSDPSGGGGGSGWYRWDGSTWSKFA